MATIQVFDPAMCCATGVCGTSVDPAVLQFAGALAWLRRQGVAIERHNLAQQPEAFVGNGEVARLLAELGDAALPVTLVGGRVLASGSYPSKEDLAAAVGVPIRTLPAAAPRAAETDPPGAGGCV